MFFIPDSLQNNLKRKIRRQINVMLQQHKTTTQALEAVAKGGEKSEDNFVSDSDEERCGGEDMVACDGGVRWVAHLLVVCLLFVVVCCCLLFVVVCCCLLCCFLLLFVVL